MARTSADLGEMDESGPVGMEDRPDLTYLVQIDPIFSVLCDHLPTRDRLRLRDVSRTFRAVVTESPSTWQHLDLSGRSRDVVVDVMRFAAVPGALTSLVLDCTDVSEMTVVVLLTRCPNLRHLGLGGAMQLMEGVLQAVSTAKRNGHAVRLKSLGLLGAPHFTASGINGIAASVAREFETLGMTTDLRPCPREHVFTAHPDEQWHLCAENPMRCRSCGKLERGCYPCLNGRTCRGCHKFWCFDCESSITRVCYECTHSISKRDLGSALINL